MSWISALVILIATLITAFISGIFGMAGGLILMGVLTALLPVATAMIVHGAIQMVSNGWRAFLLRNHIDWRIFARYALGSLVAILLLILLAWRPNKTVVYLLLGITPLMVWVPKSIIDLDIQKRGQAETAGFLVQALNTLAGVAGPLLDLFFVRTGMTRQAIVATKSATQVMAHLVKIAFWSVPVIAAAGITAMPPLWLFALAIPMSMTGTWLGGLVLERMNDVDFKRWMRWLVTLIGCIYLARAAGWL
ncbi:sulfite exporter TauE/SafE family protein [Henriciella sp.]|uniref:sulfite exporter TauE/SafE family protein n=1 Tax=Henriciella sp. TaxID=1968823 RepID=UPI00263324A5|nr:sulfite exporter TauE/SafE family protein [Henriciella sp.]